jgi:hypothetical protein
MKNPTNDPTLEIREAENGDTAAVLELYRQLVRPVTPDVEVDVRGERIEEIRADPHNFSGYWRLRTASLAPRFSRSVSTRCTAGSLMPF